MASLLSSAQLWPATWSVGAEPGAELNPALVEDPLLPIQFLPPRPLPPVQRLMAGVLGEALTCLAGPPRRAAALQREAWAWITAAEATYLFSFVNVCAALGLEPAAVRAALRHRFGEEDAHDENPTVSPAAAPRPARQPEIGVRAPAPARPRAEPARRLAGPPAGRPPAT